MRNLILVMHTSLDGFVAGPKGEFDGFEASEENLLFVCRLTEQADSTLMGRHTYEIMENSWPSTKDRPYASPGEIAYSNWYNSSKKIVLSRTLQGKNLNNTTIVSEDIARQILDIKNQPGKDILIFGSPGVSQTLMKLGLIDSYWIFVNPIVFGEGIPLFSGLSGKITLKMMSTHAFANGELAINYVSFDREMNRIRHTYQT